MKKLISTIIAMATALSVAPSVMATVIWNNYSSGYSTNSTASSQLDTNYPFQTQLADDFRFTDSYEVTDVHWIGAFFNPDIPIDIPNWNILFYGDNGGTPTGGPTDPTATALANYQLTSADVGVTDNGDGTFTYWADLDTAFMALADTTYWLVIQSEFFYPPQWGIAASLDSFGNERQFWSPYFGYYNWTKGSDVFVNTATDLAFQLTGNPVPEPSTFFLLSLGLAGLGFTRRKVKA